MRYLGLDFGLKRIGLAKSDPSGLIAQFYKTIYVSRNQEKIFSELSTIVDAEKIEAIVIGLPYHMNGEKGEKGQMAESFGEKLKDYISIPVFYEDERLTTVSAERILIEGNMSRKKRRDKIDSLAATFILQKYLDRKKIKMCYNS
ncbi:hypothetical protein AZF37_05650 [endosymbiont 'TC1' of Trimyema compressum]|uniref:Holliday junction resolvase RuvX n=1 Tax=endosymbiont 'TC1' of Trimyema compressum TaxID=243899 RepID=UPI0007F07C14|nr:Holliday junction resolvase RuvX [endosymbiont 'TC1' of Trimyema compressum]AMP20727.1 hypothetical protein AZF37_05650 [endosymbiont 'TC1' of Trimyema compressum]